MMTLRLLTCLFVIGSIAVSCGVRDTGRKTIAHSDAAHDLHNSRNSLDWAGVYMGFLPCADCEGIKTLVKLNQDLTYRKHEIYEEKSEEVFESEGKFSWDTSGNVVQLEGGNSGIPSWYAVGENRLTQLDSEGNKIEGDLATTYELTKIESGITEKYWKLQEVFGTPVTWKEGFVREPYMILKRDGNKIDGNGSCNGFSGSYKLKEDNIINISQLASTRKMCPNMEVESNMLKAMEEAARYEAMGAIICACLEKKIN